MGFNYCQQGMQHMSDPAVALREMHRALKPDGRLGLAAWTSSPYTFMRDIVSKYGETEYPSDFGADASAMKRALEEAGFREVQVQTRQLTAIFEGGVDQVMILADSISTGAAIAALPPDKQKAVRDEIRRALEAWVVDGAVHLPSESRIASACA